MKPLSAFQSSLFLLACAAIWGFAFVAQKAGGETLGPFTFNGIRFLLGGFSLLPLILWNRRQSLAGTQARSSFRAAIPGGIAMGLVLATAAAIQQIGISPAPGVMGTTPGKAAFITGLYIVLVPVLGLLLKQRTGGATWVGGLLAVVGLWFLCMKDDLSIGVWDWLELAGTPFWALHILLIDHLSRRHDPLHLSLIQAVVCGLLSLGVALGLETIHLGALLEAAVPILYAGIGSVGLAYSFQVIGQQNTHPSVAAIILSLETVFAAVGGWLLLGQAMDGRQLAGAGLMLLGLILPKALELFPKRGHTPL